MWTKIEDYDYATVPEGKVKIKVAPATDLNASMLTLDATCRHYDYMGRKGARFQLDVNDIGVYYLDLTDYVVLYWSADNG